MFKKIVGIFLFFVFCFLFSKSASAVTINSQEEFTQNVLDSVNESIVGERIEKFHSDIQIQKDGSIDVKETITYNFDSLERHGIYRNIPFTLTKNGKRYDVIYDFKSVTDEKGKKYKYTKSNVNHEWVLKIGDANKTITGIHTYVISYRAKGALRYFKDHDELFWNTTGTGWEIPIKMASTTILLPEKLSEDTIQIKCVTGVYGSTKNNCTGTSDGFHTNFVTTLFLNQYEGMSVILTFPKGTTAVLTPVEYIPFFERWYGKIVLAAIVLAATVWYIILPIFLIINWFAKGRDPDVGRAVTSSYDGPQTLLNRKLTPVETGALMDETVEKRDIFSIVVDLARRGYIKIEERDKKDFYVIKKSITQKLSGQLMPFEQKMLDGLFPTNETESRIKDIKLYNVIPDIQNSIYKGLVLDGFFPKNPQTIRTIYTILGVFGIFTFNFVLAFTAFLFGRNMPRKTLLGAQQAQVAKGLRNFLKSQERQLNFQGDKQMFFEKLLPFAVAFGVEKAWAKRFENFDLREPDWYSGTSGHFNTALFASSLSNSYNNFATASTPPSSSSSGMGGGGFSGGGGGGGGGGSW